MAASSTETPPWAVEGVEKRTAVQALFSAIAPRYDLLNSLLSFNLHRRWRAQAVATLHLSEGDSALDVCCGTGDFLVPLRKAVGASGRVLGVDFAAPMLELAGQKTREPVVLGDACRLPTATDAFDAITVGWGIRNVPDIPVALAEIARSLKPGGRFVCIDMAQPRSPVVRRVSRAVFHGLSPLLGRLFGQQQAYTYLPRSTDQFLSRIELAAAIERAGFDRVGYEDRMLGNICIHFGVKR